MDNVEDLMKSLKIIDNNCSLERKESNTLSAGESRKHLALLPKSNNGGGLLDCCVDVPHLAITRVQFRFSVQNIISHPSSLLHALSSLLYLE